jgi:hypothetical protein
MTIDGSSRISGRDTCSTSARAAFTRLQVSSDVQALKCFEAWIVEPVSLSTLGHDLPVRAL